MQQGEYASYYQQSNPYHQTPNPNPNPNPTSAPNPNPNPNLIDYHSQTQTQTAPYASAPPFSTTYDYSTVFSQNYQPYPPQNPDPTPPPTAPSFAPSLAPPPHHPHDPHGPTYPQQATANQNQPYFPPFDQQQTAPVLSSYAPQNASIQPNLNPANPVYPSMYTAAYNPVGSSGPALGSYDNLYDNSLKFDQGAGYFEDKYGRSRSDMGSGLVDPYGKRPESVRYDEGYGDGVYAYQGGKVEPYGARGTASKSSTWSGFDDFGRPISFPSSGKDSSSVGSGLGLGKIVRAVPKAEAQEDVKGGVQKFRVKLLAESGGQSSMDVLCQIGLDGIRMLDPSTSRTLRIYPLETITRCDKFDSSTFAFWSKSSVDNEPRRIRLQSNSYTTNTLLDTVTAATVQFKEMGERIRPLDSTRTAEQPTEKKKGFVDWMNMIKPANEEKDHWVPDEAVSKCTSCGTDFNAFVRRHHCRNCGDIFCDKCTHGRIALTADESAQPVRVCDRCMAEVTQRLSNAKEAAIKPVGLQSHEDLARKLQEEMAKNRKGSSGLKSDGSGRRMKEVACPTCTVHLQVQVPTSGSETIECGVCQHPFQVSAY